MSIESTWIWTDQREAEQTNPAHLYLSAAEREALFRSEAESHSSENKYLHRNVLSLENWSSVELWGRVAKRENLGRRHTAELLFVDRHPSKYDTGCFRFPAESSLLRYATNRYSIYSLQLHL